MISVRQIHKKFGKLEVLKEFNLEFEPGKSYALMGPNGSGKTTLIKIILGVVALLVLIAGTMVGTLFAAGFFKPKRALGQLGAGAVRLSEPIEGRLGLAEGSESALSAQTLFGIPCWATLGNERFGIVAIPESITELHLFVDADKGGELALKRGIEAYTRQGRTIIPHKPDRPDNDWNDELRERDDSHAAA